MGLMGKTSSAQNTPAASSAGGINASASLGALPMVEDPFGGGNVDRLSPETEENSFAGKDPQFLLEERQFGNTSYLFPEKERYEKNIVCG